jgi:membrane protease YdiL (CAAX protease family)
MPSEPVQTAPGGAPYWRTPKRVNALDASQARSDPPRSGPEIRRALWTLYLGTGALGLLALALPFLDGLLQGLLAVLLFLIPSWALRNSGLTIDDMGVHLGPWTKTLGVSLVCALLVYPVFALGFHHFHTEVTGATPAWSWQGLTRFDEALLDAPETPCADLRPHAQAWVVGDGLWLLAPSDQGLRVDLGGTEYRTRSVTCAKGAPRAGAIRPPRSGILALPRDRGVWLDLAEHEAIDLGLTSGGAALAADSIRTGARSEPSESDGRLNSSRGWGWLLAYLIVHLGIVALPEEWFFRGYLQTRLDQRWGTPWRVLGADLGWGLVASALAFALLHPILLPGLDRLLVFFPALLFGYLRARTGNIGAAVVIHATSNLLLTVLVGMYRWG